MANAPNWATGRTHRALLIGNGRLGGGGERFGPLRSPPGDVAAMRAALTDPGRGLHARHHVQVVIDAPRERVLAALRAFFDGAGPHDQLLLFYSGHGLADERGALHLGSSDTMAQFPVSTAVPAEAVGQLADASPAAAVLIVLDCRYGDAWQESPSAPLAGLKRLVLASPFGVRRADDGDRVSAFTEVVAAGLTAGRAADRNRDGLVSFAELCEFVTAELTGAGDPPPECWLPNTGADVPVARVDDPARGRADGPDAEPEWRLPGEEAPLVPVTDAPGQRPGLEPSFPPAPPRAEPPPRRVPVRAALPTGPPGAQVPSGPLVSEPRQDGLLDGWGAPPPVPGPSRPNGRAAEPGVDATVAAAPAAPPQPPPRAWWPGEDVAGRDGSGADLAAERAFPSEILPPGRRGPAGPAPATPGAVTAAPGPVPGSGRDRSRRGAVAPTDIHRPGSQAAGAERDGPISNLPQAGSRPLDAGDWLMAEIRSRVVERGERVVTLVGPGAVGPASAMVRYAGLHAGEYRVCWWLRAHDPALLAEDWRALAAELGLPAHSDLLRAVPELRRWLEDERHGPWLLVLDGAPAPEEIAPYIPRAGRGRVLITATSPGWEELSSSRPLSTARPRAAEPGRLGAPPGMPSTVPPAVRRGPAPPHAVPPSQPTGPPPRPAGPPPAGPPPPRPAPPAGDPWVERQPQRPPWEDPPPGRQAAERPARQEPPAVDDPWVERRPPRPGPRTGGPPVQQGAQRPAGPGAATGGHREPIHGEPVPPGSAAGPPGAGRHQAEGPYEPVNGRTGGPRPAGEAFGGSGRQEILHWDQALKRLRRASPQAAALLQLAAFLDSDAIPVGLLAMTGVVLPGELGASLRDPQAFRAALATLAQRGMVAHAGDRLAVPPLAQVAVGSALGGEGVRTWAAYALRVLGIALALPAGDGERPAWAEPSRLLPHAEAAVRHALALGVRTPELPTVLNEVGVHLLRMQRPDLAVPYLDRALGLAREVHGLRHREVVRALDHLALAHRQLGDEALAMRLHGEAVAISRSLDRRLLHERARYPGRP
ncbi:MAG TPA: tetratricopeptide repeat protein [Actinomycetes bacterium]